MCLCSSSAHVCWWAPCSLPSIPTTVLPILPRCAHTRCTPLSSPVHPASLGAEKFWSARPWTDSWVASHLLNQSEWGGAFRFNGLLTWLWSPGRAGCAASVTSPPPGIRLPPTHPTSEDSTGTPGLIQFSWSPLATTPVLEAPHQEIPPKSESEPSEDSSNSNQENRLIKAPYSASGTLGLLQTEPQHLSQLPSTRARSLLTWDLSPVTAPNKPWTREWNPDTVTFRAATQTQPFPSLMKISLFFHCNQYFLDLSQMHEITMFLIYCLCILAFAF